MSDGQPNVCLCIVGCLPAEAIHDAACRCLVHGREKFHVEPPGPKCRLEIRCCCNPSRLYGWLELDTMSEQGRRLHFPIRAAMYARDYGHEIADAGEVSLEIDRLTLGPDELGACSPSREFRRSWALKYLGDGASFEEKARRLQYVPNFEPSPAALAAIVEFRRTP